MVLGNVEDNGDLLALKRVNTVRRPTTQQLSFWTPEKPGRMILTQKVEVHGKVYMKELRVGER